MVGDVGGSAVHESAGLVEGAIGAHFALGIGEEGDFRVQQFGCELPEHLPEGVEVLAGDGLGVLP